MQDLSKHLALEDSVEFKLNIPYSELILELQKGMIGLHAMWNEHFGISIVECMAAGLIMIAHASGGPKLVNLEKYFLQANNCFKTLNTFRADIIETQITSQTGFLASQPEEYAKIISDVINMHPTERDAIRQAAR